MGIRFKKTLPKTFQEIIKQHPDLFFLIFLPVNGNNYRKAMQIQLFRNIQDEFGVIENKHLKKYWGKPGKLVLFNSHNKGIVKRVVRGKYILTPKSIEYLDKYIIKVNHLLGADKNIYYRKGESPKELRLRA